MEPFLIPLLDADAFQLREPRSRAASTHTHPFGRADGCLLWAPGAHPEWSSRALGVRIACVVVIHMICRTRCIIARVAGGDQSQENSRRGPRKLSICTQTDNHEDSLSVSTKSVM